MPASGLEKNKEVKPEDRAARRRLVESKAAWSWRAAAAGSQETRRDSACKHKPLPHLPDAATLLWAGEALGPMSAGM